MRKFLFYISFFLFTHTQAQGFKVRHYIPQASSNSPRALFEISPGNYIGAGFATDTATGQIINKIALVGLDQEGQLLWTKKYEGHKISYRNNGLIVRCFYKKENFLYYAGCVLDSLGAQIGVFIKFDMNGDTLWQKIYRDTASVDLIPQMVSASVDGGFLITGFFQDWVNHTQQGLLLKTDANGNELWRKKINKLAPNVQDGKAIIQDSVSKKIVIAGYQYLSSNDNYDNIVILDSLGNTLTRTKYCYFGGSALDLIQTRDKKLVMAGFQFYSQSIGGYNCRRSFAVKFDIDNPHIPLWKIDGFDKLAFRNSFTSLVELKNGNILLSGIIDTIQGVCNGPNNQPGNVFTRLTIVDKDGYIKWNRYYSYKRNALSEHNLQGINTINTCADGGWVASIADYNHQGVQPFLFVRYDSTGCDSTLAYCALLEEVGIKEHYKNTFAIKVYPNPANNFLVLSSEDQTTLAGTELTLTDVYGREVKKIKLTQANTVDVSQLNPGIYFVAIVKESQLIFTTKIVKE